MANYNRDIQRRSREGGDVVMAYVRIHPIPEAMLGINREINAERIKDLTSIVAANLHDAAETEVILRDGSIIFESLINTPLHELLSEENLYALRIIGEKTLNTGLDIAEFYAAVRSMLNLVKRTAQTVAVYIQAIAGTRQEPPDTLVVEARPGPLGNLDRFLRNADICRSTLPSAQRKARSMAIALSNAKTLGDTVTAAGSRELLCTRMNEAIKGIKPLILLKDIREADAEDISTFNKNFEALREEIETICY